MTPDDLTPGAAYMEGVRAERERIRQAMFGCAECARVHEYRRAGEHGGTWADPGDGHSYSPAHLSHRPGWQNLLAGLLREES